MPTESSYPLQDIPDIDLWDFLFERKDRKFPDDKVIYLDPYTKRSYTYAQTRKTALDFGKGLKSQWDWQKGDVLAVFSPNCIDTPAITWGTLWTGGIISSANPSYTVDELAFQLGDCQAKALVTQKPLLKLAVEAARRVGLSPDRIILIGDERDEQGKFKHFSSILNISGVARWRKPRIDPAKDLAFLVYSSGTTGHPKGVMLSHRNIVSNTMMITLGEWRHLSWDSCPDGKGDRVMAFLPFYHIYGLTNLIHQSLYAGFTLVVMPKFNIEDFCSIVQEHRITFIYAVPPVILLLGKHPIVKKYDFRSVRMINSGAAPLSKELVEAAYKNVRVPIKQGYGLTETSPTTHTQPWEEWYATVGSVGKLLPNQVAKYMAPDGQTEVPIGETGELWIKGPNVCIGYHKNPEATKQALTPDGYFKTGDIGYQDAQGNFYITDRVKELIKYKGFQVAPAELEGLLSSHPKVADVAVVGVHIPHEATEVPRAYVVPATGVNAGKETEDEIVAWLSERVAHYKRLRGGIRFIDAVPKTLSGKILRKVLKEKAAQEEAGNAPVKAKL
ncbi:acetyl-CoA synthetase-like protein [Xylona heveae TC161]|uniref:Acetyl-CoA synthetase-like protein n=1 Tax=Xylona heveae (strain CBS 132557 / TC161) TaxID=1328760 RepID=A0A165JZK8_XYLHT|nr:acetyl-CoA synthetase-like protein [Xylona heveae TC161]KZF26824.1 acetyl-CoA synthetase-like protein [Xylona heveae TC161]